MIEKKLKLYKENISLEKKRKMYVALDPNNKNLSELSKEISQMLVGRYYGQLVEAMSNGNWVVFQYPDNGDFSSLTYGDFTFISDEEFHKRFQVSKGFPKDYRGKWNYWFAHWCAYNLTAITLHCWKPKYLLHDIEKPFMLSLSKDYSKVQKWHRYHNKHHTEYALDPKREELPDFSKVDWEAAVIDWECSALTKSQAQMNARETLNWLVSHEPWSIYEETIRSYCEPVLNRLGL